MLPLAFALVIFFFLFAGAVLFVITALSPDMQKIALSAALWCAIWGPCLVGLIMLAGLVLITDVLTQKAGEFGHFHLPPWPAALWRGYFYLCLGFTALVATAVAWLHQWLIARITLALFRVYACVVCAGIGSVFGWAVAIAASNYGYSLKYGWVIALVSMVGLVIAGGYCGYKWAHLFRGKPPERLTWVTQAEYTGLAGSGPV